MLTGFGYFCPNGTWGLVLLKDLQNHQYRSVMQIKIMTDTYNVVKMARNLEHNGKQ
jgi:hypothetical protein